jgi:hypothetical protein
VSAGRHGMRLGCAGLAAALLGLASMATSQGTPVGPTRLFPAQRLHAQAGTGPGPQAGLETTVAPALVVQPGPPPVPLGEPQAGRPGPPGESRPTLPDFESDTDAATLGISPSVEPPTEGEGDSPGEKPDTSDERRP